MFAHRCEYPLGGERPQHTIAAPAADDIYPLITCEDVAHMSDELPFGRTQSRTTHLDCIAAAQPGPCRLPMQVVRSAVTGVADSLPTGGHGRGRALLLASPSLQGRDCACRIHLTCALIWRLSSLTLWSLCWAR